MMRTLTQRSLVVILIWLTYSCQNHESQTINSFTVSVPNPKKTKEANELSSIFSVKGVVPLETTNASLIGKIDKIIEIPDGKGYLVLDKTSASKVFYFNSSGLFNNCIGKKGKGPQEYRQITEVCFYKNTVYILDSSQDCIFKFSLTSEWQGKIEAPERTKDFAILGENHFVFYCLGPNEIVITDENGGVVKTIPKSQNIWQGVQSNSIIETNGFVNYRSQFSDTILSWISEGAVTPMRLYLDLPGEVISVDDYVNTIGGATKATKGGVIRTIYNIFHTSQFTYLVYTLDSELFYTIVSTNPGQKSYVFTNKIHDDISYLTWAPQIKGVGINDELLSIVYPSRITALSSFNNDFSLNVNMEDNPIVLMLIFKPN